MVETKVVGYRRGNPMVTLDLTLNAFFKEPHSFIAGMERAVNFTFRMVCSVAALKVISMSCSQNETPPTILARERGSLLFHRVPKHSERRGGVLVCLCFGMPIAYLLTWPSAHVLIGRQSYGATPAFIVAGQLRQTLMHR
ncbi:hypothetical protein TSAR_009996 [Trichomalopsis sarcophagae]|uniref:Uncharacterized protein n=3 Tax=Trichomalopsis sarcophagae TaxID=543379 RepID=A0A232FBD2_9HYME|nr:hypothetical protein TSAR_009996 [Trichomalopsis sarcophagae]